MVEEIVQVLANLYPRGIPPEAYEDAANLAVARVRAEMFRKKRLVPGQGWQDVDGTVEPFQPRQQPEAPMLNIPPDRPHRRYDLPSDSDIRALEREDRAKYPSFRAIGEKVQRDLDAGKLRVDDRAIAPGGSGLTVRVKTAGGGEMIVPRECVPENELRRIDAEEAAKIADKYQYREPTPQSDEQVLVGQSRAVNHAAPGEKLVSFHDIMNGPSMPRPV